MDTTRIKELAKAQGKTLSYVCQLIGRKVYYLNDLKKTSEMMAEEDLHIIAANLGTSVEYLKGETDDPNFHLSSVGLKTFPYEKSGTRPVYGHCGASMNGESGIGRKGTTYHYYSCYTKKRRLGCDKRPLKKDFIERIVAEDAYNLLTDELIDEIADMAIQQSEQDLKDNTHIPQLTVQLHEVEQSIDNITAAIEKGIASETLMNRLVQLEREKKQIARKIKEEEKFIYRIDRDQIVFWLSQFKYGDIENEDFRRHLIDLLINSVTVWDEPDGYKITTAYNLTSCKTKTFRVEKNHATEEVTGFGFEESECAIERISEPFIVWGTVFVQTRRHSLP